MSTDIVTPLRAYTQWARSSGTAPLMSTKTAPARPA